MEINKKKKFSLMGFFSSLNTKLVDELSDVMPLNEQERNTVNERLINKCNNNAKMQNDQMYNDKMEKIKRMNDIIEDPLSDLSKEFSDFIIVDYVKKPIKPNEMNNISNLEKIVRICENELNESKQSTMNTNTINDLINNDDNELKLNNDKMNNNLNNNLNNNYVKKSFSMNDMSKYNNIEKHNNENSENMHFMSSSMIIPKSREDNKYCNEIDKNAYINETLQKKI